MSLHSIQSEWNSLVPQAQARGLRGVRMLRIGELREPIARRTARLEWLRRELQLTTAFSAPAATEGSFTFGVELECIMPVGMRHADLARLIEGSGIPCRSETYNHTLRSSWKVVTDGSLGNYRSGAEVVSPVLSGDDGFAQLRKVCGVLTAAGCKISKRCGMHVHVGARNEDLNFFKSLIRLYKSAELAIDSFLAPSRRGRFAGNGFCNAINYVSEQSFDSASTLDEVTLAIGQRPGAEYVRSSGRYCKINLQSFWQHGTVEFRHHQGTVDANKAENWVRFCLRMALAARKGAAPVTTIDALLTTIGATESEVRYVTGRIAYFNRATARRAA